MTIYSACISIHPFIILLIDNHAITYAEFLTHLALTVVDKAKATFTILPIFHKVQHSLHTLRTIHVAVHSNLILLRLLQRLVDVGRCLVAQVATTHAAWDLRRIKWLGCG